MQAYRVGQKVKGRVIGARPLDGLSVLSLKPTVVEQQVASISEVKPGSMMSGAITSIADFGMLVSLAPGVRYITSKLCVFLPKPECRVSVLYKANTTLPPRSVCVACPGGLWLLCQLCMPVHQTTEEEYLHKNGVMAAGDVGQRKLCRRFAGSNCQS